MKIMKILVACEESQVVTTAFRVKGHEAFSCDILATSGDRPDWHIQGDVRLILNNRWDMVIAHPPCTYITNAGVRHLHSIPSRNGVITKIHGNVRFELMGEACDLFNLLSHSCDKVCVENPIPHKYARAIIGKYSQLIQPWQFGHEETKATCLWLKGLPLLRHTNIVGPPGRNLNMFEKAKWNKVHRMSPGPDRARLRSKTYPGIAQAMADQWG